MNFPTLLLIALSLAMDAFAVSVSDGIATRDFKPRHSAVLGVYFGVFQFLMPLAGFLLGLSFKEYIEAVDHWIAFLLLSFIGGKMIADTLKEKAGGTDVCETGGGQRTAKETLTPRLLVTQALATSIDALAVGVSFAILDELNIWYACGVIGVVAFLLSFVGGMLGKKIGCYLKGKAEILGGIILICIGVKILIEHLCVF